MPRMWVVEHGRNSFMSLLDALQRLLTPGIIGEILRGETDDWSRADWAAVTRFPVIDLEILTVHFLLDHTGRLGKSLISEVLLRRSMAKAKSTGSNVFCVYHDCDLKNCPPGTHED